MEQRGGRNVLIRLAAWFELPADLAAGEPKVELVGDGQLRMTNHRGILSYGTEEICISGGALIVCVAGEELELSAMSREEILITGRIRQVTVE